MYLINNKDNEYIRAVHSTNKINPVKVNIQSQSSPIKQPSLNSINANNPRSADNYPPEDKIRVESAE